MQSMRAVLRYGSVLGMVLGTFGIAATSIADYNSKKTTIDPIDAAPDVTTTKGSAACTGNCECVGNTCTCRQGGTCTFGPAAVDGGDGGVLPPDNVVYDCQSKNT